MGWFAVDGPVGRAMRKMATSSAFRKVGPKVVPPMDRTLHRLTGGRVVLSRALVPSLVLTNVGRKSGVAYETPLACVPDDDGGWWVVGSNFGREAHPAWTANLIATPEATVSYGAKLTPVRAELLSDDRVLVREAAGGYLAYGTPWPGEAGVALNHVAPLRAILFPARAAETRITPLDPGQALERLLPVGSLLWHERELLPLQLALVERMLKAVPAFELAWSPQRGVLTDMLEFLHRL